MTLIEVLTVLALIGILSGAGIFALSRFSANHKVKAEAADFQDALFRLRARAVMGERNPCLDLPDDRSYRLFLDRNRSLSFNAGDSLLESVTLAGGLRWTQRSGGSGAANCVCFNTQGVLGSATGTLNLTVGTGGDASRNIRLLASTGLTSNP